MHYRTILLLLIINLGSFFTINGQENQDLISLVSYIHRFD